VRILLDTCTFLWVIREESRLSAEASALFRNPANDVFLSAVSAWEITVKYQLGRLSLAQPPHIYVPQERVKHGIEPLPLEERAVLELRRLPPLHQDPFDRMLISQAIAENLVLLTPDEWIYQYPVSVRW
jgi:PIN domain nuclease of toxin-antitoxin system